MASSAMGRRFARKSRQEVNSAAETAAAADRKEKTSSGSSRTFGSLGTRPSNNPPITKGWIRIVSLRATSASTATASKSPQRFSTHHVLYAEVITEA